MSGSRIALDRQEPSFSTDEPSPRGRKQQCNQKTQTPERQDLNRKTYRPSEEEEGGVKVSSTFGSPEYDTIVPATFRATFEKHRQGGALTTENPESVPRKRVGRNVNRCVPLVYPKTSTWFQGGGRKPCDKSKGRRGRDGRLPLQIKR